MLARRTILLALAASAFLHDGASPAAAQSWPTRPVTMVVPFAAGGGMVGSARVAKAAPDGYQFVLGSRADAINQTLYKNPLYNLTTDLAPVVLIADQPMVLVTRKDLP